MPVSNKFREPDVEGGSLKSKRSPNPSLLTGTCSSFTSSTSASFFFFLSFFFFFLSSSLLSSLLFLASASSPIPLKRDDAFLIFASSLGCYLAAAFTLV
jgi:hypothetical protein